EHGDGRHRDRAEKEDVHSRRAEARYQGVLDHVAGKPRVLAEHDAVAMTAVLEGKAGGHADLHRCLRSHRKPVGPSPNSVRSEIASSHFRHLLQITLRGSPSTLTCHNWRPPNHHNI